MLNDNDRQAIITAKLLAMDSVDRAGSGHPGTAVALAPVAHLLFQKHLRHDPQAPTWAGRDRFVLSCGHASILLYTQLFLTGYGVSLEDLKAFRALDSLTPGHPEFGHTPGVETTTGPLGQGLATAVGMAMAMKHERAVYDADAAPGASIFDRTVWVLCSDGDLQEGISYEAGAVAGRHKLDNLVVIYDDNDIQIEGDTSLAGAEDVVARFTAQGWRVEQVGLAGDGDVDVDKLDAILASAVQSADRPSLVVLKSQIAWPAPNATNTAASHGSPFGAAEIAATRAVLGVTTEPFEINDDVLDFTRLAQSRGDSLRRDWESAHSAWARSNPNAAMDLARAQAGELPDGFADALPVFASGDNLATRDASGKVIQAVAALLPEFWGGSADLAEPNRTAIANAGSFLPEETASSGRAGRNVHWGVREHTMAAAMNGISLVDGSRFFAGTFLVFSDYQRPAIRLASLMQLPVVYVWSHDSVALGSDGPTHQPIEHLASLRAIPGFTVVRPADAAETTAAWLGILNQSGPVGLVLGRQPLRVANTPVDVVNAGVPRGAYIVRDPELPDVVVIATGSEVTLALSAADLLVDSELSVRVVSMPSREWFAQQSAEYREFVIPASLTARVIVEAGTSFGWADLAGATGEIVGIDEFGLSAPAEDAQRARGMTAERVVAAIHATVAAARW
ncbi:transketolase [Cryobacterium sp. N22]|uniref:transketolase n=1 Tax=Cryobacterium sp. N22 TaxID=2048290 RepID=UPI002100D660|nr:transketolase [Cryobacterium sp. N22]